MDSCYQAIPPQWNTKTLMQTDVNLLQELQAAQAKAKLDDYVSRLGTEIQRSI